MSKNYTVMRLPEKPDYGNWVSMRLVFLPALIGLVLLILALLFPMIVILAALFLLMAAYFAYARWLFSARGGDVQDKVYGLVLEHLDWNGQGRLLDVGCGSGALTIKLAKKYPDARLTGVDYWGASWEYSKKVCEKNAAIEGVNGRITFQQASALKLPFEDETFDAIVSNLTFHEVRDAKDKKELIREALRVLRKGGTFTFQDLFLIKRAYGTPEELVNAIKGWGISDVEFIDTHNEPFIPGALKLPFMVGTISIIKGKK